MSSSLRDAADALGRTAEAVGTADWADAEAVGMGVDDPADIRGICVVITDPSNPAEGRIFYEQYAPGIEALPQDQYDDVVRVCRWLAWSSWRAQRVGAVTLAV